MNIVVNLNYPIKDGSEVVFRSPVDCSQITGLKLYYPAEDGTAASKEFALADAHGNNVGDIDHLFAENVVVKVILDVSSGMAFVQNADTNAYLEGRFADLDDIVDSLCATTVTGNPIEITDFKDNKLRSMKVLHTTESEVTVSVSGKNLLTLNGGEASGITCTIEEDGGIHVVGTPTAAVAMTLMPNEEFAKLQAGTHAMKVRGLENAPVVNVSNKNYTCGLVLMQTDKSKNAKFTQIDNKDGCIIPTSFSLPNAYLYLTIPAQFKGTPVEFTLYPTLLFAGNIPNEDACKTIGYTPRQTATIDVALQSGWEDLTLYNGYTKVMSDANCSIEVEYLIPVDDAMDTLSRHYGEFDAAGYGLPVLKLTGQTGPMTKENEVELRYEYGERTGKCNVKWQGNSSLQYEKKNYTIKFDNAFEAVSGWGVQKKYCLKANFVDFTQARNVCSAKLWGQVVATREGVPEQLAAAPNYGAVDGFPIALYINDKYYGVYTFNIPKDKWTFNMGTGVNEAAVCAAGPPSKLVDGVWVDDSKKVRFREPGVRIGTDYDVEYAPDENNVQWIVESLDTMIGKLNPKDADGNAIDVTADDMAALNDYIDWDSVIDYIIFTCATNGYDGITKNHVLLTYNGTKWYFSAYDMDCTFGIHGSQGKLIPMSNTLAQQTTIETMCTLNRAMVLVRRHKKAELVARYNELRSGVLSEDNVITTFTNFVADIPKALYDEECLIWKTLPGTSISNVHQIADFYKRKCAILDAEIAAIKL